MSLVFNPFTGTFDFTGGSGGGGSTSPALPFDSVQFNNAGSFGGSANLTWADLFIVNTDPTFSYWYWGGEVSQANLSGVAAAAFAQTGSGPNPIYTFAETKAGLHANPAGAQLTATNSSAAALDGDVIGVFVSANQTAGTITNVFGVHINNELDSGTTISGDASGMRINFSNNGATIGGDLIGVRVDNFSADYAIKTLGTAPSLFGGVIQADGYKSSDGSAGVTGGGFKNGLWTATPVLTLSGNLTTTGAFNPTFAIPSSSTWTFPSGSDTVVTLAATQTLTNKRITKRVVTASDATSITPNSDSADITYQANTQGAGTLTINADGGTPTNGQSWVLKIKSTSVQTFSWNSIFVGGTVALPTATTGGGKIDYFVFLYDTVTPKWDYTGTATGF